LVETIAVIGFSLVVTAYLAQLHKIYTCRQSAGISISGYIVTFVNLAGYIVWSKGTIGSFKLIELLLHISTLLLILIYAPQNKIDAKSVCIFIVTFIGSLFLVGGIAQAYKSYTFPHENSVSIIHYLAIFTANLLYLGVAFLENERLNVFAGLLVTNLFYIYILYQSITNRLR
jgi:uncharacterized protein with PQ loop repeat